MTDWAYDSWAPVDPANWRGARHDHPSERDCHVDLGCGTIKKGRIGIDRYPAPGVDIVMNLDALDVRLPFDDDSIESIVTHHFAEHCQHFIPLMDEVYRVLKPSGTFRLIVPLFPSSSAVADPDHRRYFMEGTMLAFCGHLGSEDNPTGCWTDSFSQPYTKCRFEMLDEDMTPRCEPALHWTPMDVRELRVALRCVK